MFRNFTVQAAGGGVSGDVAEVPPHVSGAYPPRYLKDRPAYGIFIRRVQIATNIAFILLRSSTGTICLSPRGAQGRTVSTSADQQIHWCGVFHGYV